MRRGVVAATLAALALGAPSMAATQGSDIVVVAVTFDPPAPTEGDVVSAFVTIENRGGAASGTVTSQLSLRDVKPWTNRSASLDAGARRDLVFRIGAVPVGAWNFTLDAKGSAPDAFPENNSHRGALVVGDDPALKPNLKPSRLDWPYVMGATGPRSYDEDDFVSFEYSVANVGSVVAPGGTVRFFLDDAPMDSELIDTWLRPNTEHVEANRMYSRTSARTFSAGDHTLRMVADAYGEVDESDESDNERRFEFTIRALPIRPNLTVTSLLAEPTKPAEREPFALVARIANLGRVDAGPSSVKFLVDHRVLGAAAVPALVVNASADVRLEGLSLTLGDHDAEAWVDPEGRLDEVYETDNIGTTTVHVGFPKRPTIAMPAPSAASVATTPQTPPSLDEAPREAPAPTLGALFAALALVALGRRR